MTAISTPQELIHVLETNREFREVARRLLLSQDLLDMPDRLVRLTATVEDFSDEQEQFQSAHGCPMGMPGHRHR